MTIKGRSPGGPFVLPLPQNVTAARQHCCDDAVASDSPMRTRFSRSLLRRPKRLRSMVRCATNAANSGLPHGRSRARD